MDTEHVYKTALYLRLSKDDTDIDGSIKKESNSIGSQRDLLKAYIKNHNDMEISGIYTEMKIAYLIQRARIEYRENRRNKGFRHNERVRELLFL